MRTAIKVMLICSAAFLLLVAGGLVWLVRSIPPPTPPTEALPMLVRDLPGEVDEAKRAFQRRVLAQYPEEIGAAALADNLRGKGFRINIDRKNGLVIAVLEQRSFPCVRGWVIHWKPDGQNRARSIGAYYNLSCP